MHNIVRQLFKCQTPNFANPQKCTGGASKDVYNILTVDKHRIIRTYSNRLNEYFEMSQIQQKFITHGVLQYKWFPVFFGRTHITWR